MTLSPRFHKIYAAVTGAAAAVAGICLMVACVGIWGAGDASFSPDSVKAAFTPISIPVYLCLTLVMGGAALDALSPADREKSRAKRDPAAILQRLYQKADISNCEEDLFLQISTTFRKCTYIRWAYLAVPALLAAIFLGYAVNPGHYSSEDVTGSVIQAMSILLPCVAAAMVCCLVLRRHLLLNTEKLIVLLKQAPQREHSSAPAPAKKSFIPLVQALLFVAAIVMIAYGAVSGGTTDVLAKAVNICTECVGLG